MKKNLQLLMTVVALAFTTLAQAQMTHEVAGALQIQGTYRESKLGDLNTALAKGGLASLPENNYWLNLSMSHIHKQWIFEDGIGGTFTSESQNAAGVKGKYNQYQFFSRVAYNFSKGTAVRVYPFAGINVSDAMLRIQDNPHIQSTSDFSTELLNSSSSKTLWNPNFGFDVGAGYDFVIKMKSKQVDCYTIERNIPIGFRAGYYFQVTNNTWRLDDNYKLNNNPTQRQNAFFVTLNIGLGYAVKK